VDDARMEEQDGSQGGRTGVLVLRAWLEGDQSSGLRVRITRVIDRREPSVVAAAAVDIACDIVRAWLEELLDRGDAPSRSPR
jgi:hypothetical protein